MAGSKEDIDLIFSHQITVRLSDVEYDLITTSAKNAGLTVSEYVRQATIDAKVVYNIEIVANMPRLMALTTEYDRIGNILNQIAAFSTWISYPHVYYRCSRVDCRISKLDVVT